MTNAVKLCRRDVVAKLLNPGRSALVPKKAVSTRGIYSRVRRSRGLPPALGDEIDGFLQQLTAFRSVALLGFARDALRTGQAFGSRRALPTRTVA